MLVATWNVNSVRARLDHLVAWLGLARPDVICLQELKCEEAAFPLEALATLGYDALVAGQKTYNGVAILSRHPWSDPSIGISGLDDPQQRLVSATIRGVRIASAYVPNGQAVGTDKFAYKLRWLDALRSHLARERELHPQLVLTGDFNIAPDDRDVHADWTMDLLVSPEERQALRNLEALGLTDAFRLFDEAPGRFTWWDYRAAAFRRNLGVRIDHFLISESVRSRTTGCWIDSRPRQWERPSDHAPVLLELVD